jgi:hypothetical protein
MHPRFLHARALIAAAAAAVLMAACSGGGSSLTPPTAGLSPAGQPAAQAPSLTAQHEHRGGGDDDNNGGGSGGTSTFTLTALVNGLSADSSLGLRNASKRCDATLTDAPTYTAASFTALTVPKVITLNDCNPANVGLTLGATNDFVVLVDITQGNATTAIAGPATETLGVLSFVTTLSTLTLAKGDQYAFFIATGTVSSSGGCGDDNGEHHHRHSDILSANDHHGDRDGDHHGDCDSHHHGGDGDHNGDGDHHGDGGDDH